jgi:hypothetical protein
VFSENCLAAVTFPIGIKSINAFAFAENQLTSVIFPVLLKSIGGLAFQHNQLTRIVIGGGVTIEKDMSGKDAALGEYGESFSVYYNTNSKRAGAYRYTGGAWHYETAEDAVSRTKTRP